MRDLSMYGGTVLVNSIPWHASQRVHLMESSRTTNAHGRLRAETTWVPREPVGLRAVDEFPRFPDARLEA